MDFTVIDPKTGGYPDLENIVLHEEWAKGLVYCDMEGFAIQEDGSLVLMDQCGGFRYCPDGRFKVVLDEPNEPLTLEQLREMDGKPVWVEDVKHWALIDIEKGGQWYGVPFAIWAENGTKFTYNVESRGLHCYRRNKHLASGYVDFPFCPFCGKPQTDEAVQMVMERLEQIKCKN